MKLDRDVFLALAAIVWADGVVTKEERESLLQAADACGLEGADLAAVKKALDNRTTLDDVRSLVLDEGERVFAYGIAVWLAHADGVVSREETEALAQLGDMLGLSARDRALALAAAQGAAIGAMPDSGATHSRPELVSTLAEEIRRSGT